MRRLFRLVGREPGVEDDVRAELESHLAMKVEALMAAGLGREEAEAEARRQFGAPAVVAKLTLAEARRREWGRRIGDRVGGWAIDLRQAVRSLLRAPGFAITACLILGLGIGSTLAMLAVADRVLFRPLPYADADRVALLFEARPDGAVRLPSYPTVRDWQAQGQSFEAIAYVPGTQVGWRRDTGTETLLAAFPSAEFFGVMRAPALLGRVLTPVDQAEAARVAVLTHAFWKRRFGGDPAAVGTTLSLTDGPVTVVGVLAPGFRVPNWADLYLPLGAAPASLRNAIAFRGNHADSQVFGRLRPGVSMAEAVAGMGIVAERLAQAYPDEQGGWTGVRVIPLPAFLADPSPLGAGQPSLSNRTVALLSAAVVLVLAVACANVAGLTLVRGSARQRELAIRTAIGAGRGALIRRLLIESALLALVGAALGLGLAAGLIALVQDAMPGLVPRADEIRFDPRLLGLTVILGGVAAIGSGLVPAFRATARPPSEVVLGGGRATRGASRILAQRSLVVAQLGVAVTLTLGAGVLARSFVRVLDVPVGFEPRGLLAVSVHPDLARHSTSDAVVHLYRSLIETVERVPGVEAVAVTNHVPTTGSAMLTPLVVGGREPAGPGERLSALFRVVSPNYFEVMRIPVVRGRVFAETDLAAPNDGLVVNETLARRYWPGQDPLGRRLTVFKAARWLPDFGHPISGVVIGVVGDVRHFGAETAPADEVYLPYTWNPWAWTSLVVRTAGDPSRLVDPVWAAVASVDPDLPRIAAARPSVVAVTSMLAAGRAPRRLVTGVAAVVAGAALLLAMVGLYGVTAYQVGLRRREIGIRGALGARRSEILGRVLREGVGTAAIGVALGLAGGWVAAALLENLVFGGPARDIGAFAVAAASLLAVAAAAVLPSALRAVRVDPVEVLRAD